MKKTQKLLTGGMIISSVLVLSGCGCTEWASKKAGEKIMEKAIESGSGGKADVDVNKGQISINAEDGQTKYSAGENVSLPDGFPEDIFIYDDAKIKMAISNSSENGGFSVSYVTSSGESEVFSKYKEEMVKNGWKKDTETDMGANGKMLNFSKGKSNVLVVIGTDDSGENAGKASVGLNVSIENSSGSSSGSAGEEAEE